MADPITTIGLIASIVQLINTTLKVIRYANDVKGSSADQARFGMETSSLLALLISLRYDLENSTSENAWSAGMRSLGVKHGPIDQLKELLESIAKKMRPQTGLKKVGSKLIWPIEKEELVSVFQRIERIKTLISLAYNRDNLALSLAIKAGIDDVSCRMDHVSAGIKNMEINLSRQQKEELLTWLSPLTYQNKQNDLFQRYQEGTGKWLLEANEFLEWHSTSGKILWCPGMPGAGKTTLASFVISEIQRSLPPTGKVGLAYIFCNYKNDHQTAINIAGSLLRQLLGIIDVPECVTDLNNSHKSKCTQPTLWEITNCLKDVIRLSLSDAFIIVDALDEYDEGDGVRDSLAGTFMELASLPNSHVLVTSRWLTSIERAFEGSLRLEIRATDQDVTKYVEKRIEISTRLQRQMKEDSDLKKDVVDTIVEKCQGMFLLARLHMVNIATKPHVRAIREALKTIPRKLEDTYDLVMQRISDQNEDDADLARKMLSWLTYSVRPLTVVELQHALAIEPGQGPLDSYSLVDEEIMLSVCAGIVTVEDESKLIQFIHYTTQEYLERIRDTRFPTARLEITDACMEYLQRQSLKSEPLSDTEIIERIQSEPFYLYAAMYWGAHADGEVQKSAETRILNFLKNEPAVRAGALKVLCEPVVRAVALDGLYESYGEKLLFPRQSGLHVAAYFGLSHILECLIKAGNKWDLRDSLGQTPLHVAVSRKQIRCVEIILDQDKFQEAWTLMRIAAIQGLPEFARLAIKYGDGLFTWPDPFAKVFQGWTVLHEAILAHHIGIVEILCDSGFEVDSVDLRATQPCTLQQQNPMKTSFVSWSPKGLISIKETYSAKHHSTLCQ